MSESTPQTTSQEKKDVRTSAEYWDNQIEELKAAITASGGEIDEDILSKLTGKAAAYFVKVLSS